MRILLPGALLIAALLVPAAPSAAQCCGATHEGHAMAPAAAPGAGCCGTHAKTAPAATSCCEHDPMPCCEATAMPRGDDAVPADDPAVALAGLGLAEPPMVQVLDVFFRDPVRVGDRVLMGAYRIEHDTARMARGEPCTYIYARDDLRLPVVTFHCEHLTAPSAPTATVTLAPATVPGPRALTAFQFAGETAAHGVPAAR